jgi:osmotically-inducible protein OsmY
MTDIVRMFAGAFVASVTMLGMGCESTAQREQHERLERHERTGEYIDDSVLTAKVKAAIFNEPNLKSAEINVETFKGVVQLSGFVSSAAAEHRAVEIARRIEGVKSVKNDMRLK